MNIGCDGDATDSDVANALSISTEMMTKLFTE